MKVCILSVVEMKHMVMSSMYLEYFKDREIECDIIYLDRYHAQESANANRVYRVECPRLGVLSKLLGYVKFICFSKKILKKNQYDFIVVWNEYTAVLFSGFLRRKFPKKYSINIRDLFNEESVIKNPRVLNPILAKSLSKSLFSTVSSEKYLEHLPHCDNWFFVHSINNKILPQNRIYIDNCNVPKPIQILYIGKIGYYEEINILMNALCNDRRFLLKFVGVGSEKVKKYADYISCTNVEFVGKFESDKTVGYLQEADIIYNVYGNKRICERTALSNKMYYAACLNVPILVCKNTYMYEVAKRCGIGFAVDHCDSSALPDSLFNWFINIDRTASKQKCKAFIKDALESQKKLYDYMDSIFCEKM